MNHQTRKRLNLPWFCYAAGLVLALCGVGKGEDFRVDTRVFQGRDELPHATNTTIFRNGQVYDIQTESRELTIYAPRLQRIILLSPKHKQKTELSTEQLERFCAQLKERGTKATDSGLKFMLQPNLSMQAGSGPNERVFPSDFLTYQVETFSPRAAEIAEQYGEFSDLSAKLNALTNRGWPPFPRLQVNAALAAEGLVPSKVTLLIPAKSVLTGKNVHLRSEHEFLNRLTDSDQQKIAAAEDAFGTFDTVTLREFLQPPGE
jgi:hypothetical protein